MPVFKTLRRIYMGLSTVLGGKRQGFFIPYRYAGRLGNTRGPSPYQHINNLFSQLHPLFLEYITYLLKYTDELRQIGPDQPPQPRWNQSWFPPLDAAIAYSFVRHHAPKTIIEVGSGHSTRFMARAVKDGLLETKIIAIDPTPRATLDGLNITIEYINVEKLDISFFDVLIAGDILFIDSSHIMMPGTDVDYLLNRILPRLPKGVIIHIHDIFLPNDYPGSWKWRGYNEQLSVATLLQGQGYSVLFSSNYVATHMGEYLKDTLLVEIDRPNNWFENSLWLKKV